MKLNKRIFALPLSLIFIISSFPVNAFAQENDLSATSDLSTAELKLIYDEKNYENKFVPGEIIIGLNKSNNVEVETFEEDVKADVKVEESEELLTVNNEVERDIIVIKLEEDTEEAVLKGIEELKNDPNIAFAEPNYITSITDMAVVTTDTYYTTLYGMEKIGAPSAWNITIGDASVMVGILDTGVDYTHPDLSANVSQTLGYNFVEDNDDPMDYHGRGTHVAGTIGASGNNNLGIIGVCQEVTIVPIKILDDNGYGDNSDMIKGINYAESLGIPILNMSIANYTYSESVKIAFNAYTGLAIISAGNSNYNNDDKPIYPGSYDCDNIITVAATTETDTLSDFSNYGPSTVELGAPGTDIYSTFPGGGYGRLSGTSMATSHVAGSAALILSYDNSLSTAELKEAILEGVDEVSALNGKTVTGGRLNVYNSLKSALNNKVDKAKLKILIELANGLDLSRYRIGVEAFIVALNDANAVADDPFATQDKVDSAYNNLLKAIVAMRY